MEKSIKICNICNTYEAKHGNKCESCHGVIKHTIQQPNIVNEFIQTAEKLCLNLLDDKRHSGATTRIIDRCVQELFTTGTTYVFEGRENKQMTREVFHKFKKRMESEHPHVSITHECGVFDRIYCYKVQIKK